jgi:hypothetical protein
MDEPSDYEPSNYERCHGLVGYELVDGPIVYDRNIYARKKLRGPAGPTNNVEPTINIGPTGNFSN